ncbi:hypothetical protein O6H91_10G087200 [Diphasiastrum complanatum]|uniref:Uncharacterized protein n=1 Tax=Diphasiastrum complanatum TaxID=34168 RepID=A0ACC2CK05_DIPCM|nr:hypothetical protein O6H91_10G087200 [Diphasiastrum complanatum]
MRSSSSCICQHCLSMPPMSFLPFGGKKTRSPRSAEASNARSKWNMGRYERLNEGIPGKRTDLRKMLRRKRTKTLKLGSSSKRSHRVFRIFRLRLKWVPPILLLKRLRDAYVDMMIKIASSGYVASLSRAYPLMHTL